MKVDSNVEQVKKAISKATELMQHTELGCMNDISGALVADLKMTNVLFLESSIELGFPK